MEDYVAFQLERLDPPGEGADLLRGWGLTLARTLRAERSSLSAQEVDDALAARLSVSPGDLAVVDWNTAVLLVPNRTRRGSCWNSPTCSSSSSAGSTPSWTRR
ncbi:MAG: hypothetical protein ACREOF_18405 [Gemmatimonadales bacterium]